MKFIYLNLFALVLFSLNAFSQTQTPGITVGLLYSENDQVSEGYVLYSPSSSNKAYLIDNCGYVVNEWTFNGSSNYSGTYLLKDGSICKLNLSSGGGAAAFGSACFERRDWDDNLIWSYCGTGRYEGIHSDFYHLPNGNFIALVQDPHSASEAIQMGVNPNSIGNSYDTESVIEFSPIGTNDAEVVWEWHLWDHLIQDFDPNMMNYGVVADHPEKYDANIMGSLAHFNGMHYDAERDHIIMSSWQDGEIYIIDHSINSYDAAGPAGDFLWRWGKPSNYDAPGSQMLSGQHNPKFIPDNYAVHGGKISVFNNGYSGASGSGSCIINAVYDPLTNTYAKGTNGAFLPEDFDFVWAGDIFPGDDMYSGIMGGADVQSNGNIVTCEATTGRFSESTPDGDVVWIYQSPQSGNGITNQGGTANSDVYKVSKYAPDYAGLVGNLQPQGLVENENTISELCLGFSSDFALDILASSITNLNTFSCGTIVEPEIRIYNIGSDDISSMDFEYSINGGAVSNYSWTGSILNGEQEIITLPSISYIGQSTNEITVDVISVNSIADQDPANNIIVSNWSAALETEIGTFVLELQTDNWGYETDWNIVDENGNVVHSGDGYDSNQFYTEDLDLNDIGCYTFTVNDSYGDGIIGGGYISLTDPAGVEVINVSNFGGQADEDFSVIDPNLVTPTAGFEYETNGDEVTLVNTSSGDIDIISWDFGNGTTSTETNPDAIIYDTPGTYTVCVTVTNAAGTDEECQDITVQFVGIEDFLPEGYEIYPNPLSNTQQLNVVIPASEAIISIFNLNGQLLQQKNLEEGANIIDLIELSNGSYFIKIASAEGVFSNKLIINQ